MLGGNAGRLGLIEYGNRVCIKRACPRVILQSLRPRFLAEELADMEADQCHRRESPPPVPRSVFKRHIFFLFFSQLSRRKVYTSIVESTPVACESRITNGTTVKRPNAVNCRLENTVERAGRAGRWRCLVGAVRRISGPTVSESSERSIFA